MPPKRKRVGEGAHDDDKHAKRQKVDGEEDGSVSKG